MLLGNIITAITTIIVLSGIVGGSYNMISENFSKKDSKRFGYKKI